MGTRPQFTICYNVFQFTGRLVPLACPLIPAQQKRVTHASVIASFDRHLGRLRAMAYLDPWAACEQ
jgi:hypothetical protein